jgi:intein-encoded DNA endonuclease-like protein
VSKAQALAKKNINIAIKNFFNIRWCENKIARLSIVKIVANAPIRINVQFSGAYLHVSDETATEVLLVGVPQAGAAVLLVG